MQNVLKSNVARFITHVQTCFQVNKGCRKLREYWLLIGLNDVGLRHLLQNKFGKDRKKKAKHVQILLSKVELLSLSATTFRNFQQPDLVQDRFERGR